MPFFTILTATLNNEKNLKENIASVKNQIYKKIEHIIIDGGSCDSTIEILKKYEQSYPFHWISETDTGIADALNKGLRIAKGEFIIVLHADDVLFNEETLSSVFSLINKSQKDIYSFPVLYEHPIRGHILLKPNRHLWYNHFRLIFRHQGCFVHRSVFDKIRGFNTSYRISMDYDFFYRALKHKCSVEFFDRPVSIMGGKGLSSVVDNVPQRLKEDRLVQAINEDNKFWKTTQKLFWSLYVPYKNRLLKKASVKS
jgi:glycosyltransferase involved in cell wall biosynthesis